MSNDCCRLDFPHFSSFTLLLKEYFCNVYIIFTLVYTVLCKSTYLSLWSAHVCNALVSVLSPKSSPWYLWWETDHDLQNRNNAHCTGTRVINSFCVFMHLVAIVKKSSEIQQKAFDVLHQKGESSAIRKGGQVDPDCLYCSNGEGWVQKNWHYDQQTWEELCQSVG